MIDLEATRTLADVPAVQARERGGAVAISFEGEDITFDELDARSTATARALVAAGVAPGDRVAVLSKNHAGWYPLFFGSGLARACLMPINCRLSAPEIAFIVADGAPAALFVGEDFFETALAAVAEMAVKPRLVALYGAHPAFEPLDAFVAAGEGAALPGTPELADDILQLYTSGTTGRPKGVVLTNANYRTFMELAVHVDGFSYEAGDSVMIVMPLFHVAGTNVSFSALAQGCRIVLVKDFTAAGAVRTMVEERIASAFLAPAMILMMLQTPEVAGADFSALKSISYGASPIAEDVLRRAQETFGCDFVQFYGMTESAGAGSYLAPSRHVPHLLKSCGAAWPGTELAILDPEGNALPPGEIGEIAIRGGIVMKGYWNRPEATAETVVDGWLRTGDAGYRDAEGHFFVHDRIKDLIVSGGENVYPAEVENAVAGCPGVADVAVIGVPDERWGEAVKALVVRGSDAVSADEVIAWTRARIAGFKTPKSVDFVEALPRNASGKVLRRELRAPYWAGRDRAVG